MTIIVVVLAVVIVEGAPIKVVSADDGERAKSQTRDAFALDDFSWH